MDKITEFLESIDAEKNASGAYVYTHESGDAINLYYMLKEYEEKSKWIDVYDSMPEIEGKYLVVVENNEAGISYFYKDNHYTEGSFAYPGVKYWMPLPEAPKDNNGTAKSA